MKRHGMPKTIWFNLFGRGRVGQHAIAVSQKRQLMRGTGKGGKISALPASRQRQQKDRHHEEQLHF